MTADVEKFKLALRIDGDEDDGLIETYLNAASNFVIHAVGPNEDFYNKKEVESLFNVAVLSIAGTYYQYRTTLSDVQTYPIDQTADSIIGQLRGLYLELEEEDASENTA